MLLLSRLANSYNGFALFLDILLTKLALTFSIFYKVFDFRLTEVDYWKEILLSFLISVGFKLQLIIDWNTNYP